MTRIVNIASGALSDRLDEAGFRHRASAVGGERIGAGVYEAEAGAPIWPYHYHHGLDEILYVLDGAPVLRTPTGERALAPGDLVAFPSGYAGAHTMAGPGRFVVFSGEHGVGPTSSVYPDSDKVSLPGGVYLRSGVVDYWHGEGTAGTPDPPAPRREPATPPPPGPPRLEATPVELAPGEHDGEYRIIYGREQLLLVLAGTPALRHAEGETALTPGDLAILPDGPAGAHQLINTTTSAASALRVTTTRFPYNMHLPDTGRWRLHHAPGDDSVEP